MAPNSESLNDVLAAGTSKPMGMGKRNSSSSCELDKLYRVDSTPKGMDVQLAPTQEDAMQQESTMVKKAAAAAGTSVALPFGSIALAVAVVAAAALAHLSAKTTVSVVFPDPYAILEASVCIAVGMATAPLPFACMMWMAHGRNRTIAATPLLDVLCLLYGCCALAIPFLMPIDNLSKGMGLMGQALVTWIAFWKMCDIVGGTAPPAVLASPLNLLAHLFILVEYQIDASAEANSSTAVAAANDLRGGLPPTQPWWRNQGLLGAVRPPPDAALRALVELATTGIQIALLGTLRLNDPPSALVANATGLALQQAAFAYSSVWVVYLNLKVAADANAFGLTLLGFQPKVAFRNPLTASTSPVDFWSRRWNMIVRGLFHRTIFTPMRNHGVPAQAAALASFVVSGAFHEYAFFPANGISTFGCEMIFFLIQACFCTLELALKASGAHKSRLAITYNPPDWLKVIGTSALLVPFSPFFMAPLSEGGTLDAMLASAPRLKFAWEVAALPLARSQRRNLRF